MGDWTPEPWIEENLGLRHWAARDSLNPSQNFMFDYHNRRRAMHCVNACAGMEDPMEEINTLRFEVSTESATKHHFREAGKRLEDKDAEIAKLQARVSELEESVPPAEDIDEYLSAVEVTSNAYALGFARNPSQRNMLDNGKSEQRYAVHRWLAGLTQPKPAQGGE